MSAERRPIWDDREPPGVDNRRRATVTQPCRNCGQPVTATPSKLTPFCNWRCSQEWSDLEARFWRKVGPPTVVLPHVGPCRDWLGKVDEAGYGKIRHNDSFRLAHRVSFELAHGSLPAGMLICHKCSRRTCVAPDHLYAGTADDNMRDLALDNSGSGSKTEWEDRYEMVWAVVIDREPVTEVAARYDVSKETVDRWCLRFMSGDRVPELMAAVLRTEMAARS